MNYNRPPLPFMGAKIAILKRIKVVLENMEYAGQIHKDTIFYDVFGGSGLISHNIKQWYPNNRVIWNDFDNFQERLENISKTESLRARVYAILNGNRDDKIPTNIMRQIKEVLEQEEYLDCVTLSAYLLFGGNYTKTKEDLLTAKSYYNRIPKSQINAKGYLEGVERVSKHFLELLAEIPQELKTSGKACLILDPPYLQTQKGNYRDCYTLKDFCLLVEHIFKPYIFFSSEKSDILVFFEFYQKYNANFKEYCVESENLMFGKQAGLDYMIYSCTQKGLFECL